MSWDIVIFSSKQKIRTIEEVDKELLVVIDFNIIMEKHFINIIANQNQRKIKGEGYVIDYFVDTEPVSNKVFSLYGEAALFELVKIARIYDWQIFDTGIEEMIDLEHPEKNGYGNFQKYLRHVLKNTGN
ncbi:hypothetical protein SAMN04488511_109207 [Pedobacter suwonensis]|uniref:Uncharacterized protein n=1 Tax=Pedobacter suwonensis TaxID=332999 RepID=A0A1I0TGI5_9SPHI|nr:hypothetical protein [Pedobacter suwonensis]SFA50908.1 hypothetical protein SAMN04488511_109207 [Pedobacter suwonensis]